MVSLIVYDRIKIGNILPAEGSIEKAIIANDIRDKIVLTQEEIKDFEFVSDQNGMRWSEKGNVGKDFEFTELELQLLKSTLADMDKKGKIPTEKRFVELYKKIIGNETVVEKKVKGK